MHTFEPMSQDEWRTFKSHTFLGEMIMDVHSSPIITMAAKIALTHHEKWDGTGYPMGLSGEDIPLAGRITAVADVFDALSSKAPLQAGRCAGPLLRNRQGGAGTHFDPRSWTRSFPAAKRSSKSVSNWPTSSRPPAAETPPDRPVPA